MRTQMRHRMDAGIHCLAAWEDGRIVAYDMLAPSGAEDVTTSPGTCFGLDLYERRESRGRGIGVGLLAASLSYARDLGFSRQATIVLERNRPMIAAATQMLGFEVDGPRRAQRAARPRALELAGAWVKLQCPPPARSDPCGDSHATSSTCGADCHQTVRKAARPLPT